jgi:predicted acylesterase/phospholipase RssA
MSQLRIAMTLPGEASLGAFQAGAVSALIVAVQALNKARRDGGEPGRDEVRLDTMTGASSGSLTAVLGAHALLTGQDPVAPLRRAWVVEPTLEALRGRDARAPLSLERAREVAAELLAVEAGDAKRRQTDPVMVHFALTSLRGFTYDITPAPRASITTPPAPIKAASYRDWAVHTLERGCDWRGAVDTAIASASHPAAFAPTLLDRGELKDEYERNGVLEFPDCSVLWYTDGGLLDREPLGRCIDVVRELDGEGSERVVLLLRPEPDVGFTQRDRAWTEDDDVPAWKTVLARVLRIVVTHSLYEDLRRVERVNSRVKWREEVADLLAGLVPDGNEQQLAELLDRIRAERYFQQSGEAPDPEPLPAGKRDLLNELIAEATGLKGKREIDVHVISSSPSAAVAGGSLLNFGGFLAERLRANDFLVGYMAMLTWMESRGGPYFDGAPLEAAQRRAADIPGWIGGIAGRRRLSWRDRADVARVVGRAARIGLRGNSRPRV